MKSAVADCMVFLLGLSLSITVFMYCLVCSVKVRNADQLDVSANGNAPGWKKLGFVVGHSVIVHHRLPERVALVGDLSGPVTLGVYEDGVCMFWQQNGPDGSNLMCLARPCFLEGQDVFLGQQVQVSVAGCDQEQLPLEDTREKRHWASRNGKPASFVLYAERESLSREYDWNITDAEDCPEMWDIHCLSPSHEFLFLQRGDRIERKYRIFPHQTWPSGPIHGRRLLSSSNTTTSTSTPNTEALDDSSSSSNLGIGIVAGFFIAVGVIMPVVAYSQRKAIQAHVGALQLNIPWRSSVKSSQSPGTDELQGQDAEMPPSITPEKSINGFEAEFESDSQKSPESDGHAPDGVYYTVASVMKSPSPLYGNTATPASMTRLSPGTTPAATNEIEGLLPEMSGVEERTCDEKSNLGAGIQQQAPQQPDDPERYPACGEGNSAAFSPAALRKLGYSVPARCNQRNKDASTGSNPSNAKALLDASSTAGQSKRDISKSDPGLRESALSGDTGLESRRLSISGSGFNQDDGLKFIGNPGRNMAPLRQSVHKLSSSPSRLMHLTSEESEDGISKKPFSYIHASAVPSKSMPTADEGDSSAKSKLRFAAMLGKDRRPPKPPRFKDVLAQLKRTMSQKQKDDGNASRIQCVQQVSLPENTVGAIMTRSLRSVSLPMAGLEVSPSAPAKETKFKKPTLPAARYTGALKPAPVNTKSEMMSFTPVHISETSKPMRRRTMSLSVPSRASTREQPAEDDIKASPKSRVRFEADQKGLLSPSQASERRLSCPEMSRVPRLPKRSSASGLSGDSYNLPGGSEIALNVPSNSFSSVGIEICDSPNSAQVPFVVPTFDENVYMDMSCRSLAPTPASLVLKTPPMSQSSRADSEAVYGTADEEENIYASAKTPESPPAGATAGTEEYMVMSAAPE